MEISGHADEIKTWTESVKQSFGTAGVSEFLSGEVLCSVQDTVSHSLCCSLTHALENGTASHLIVKHQDKRNIAKFFKVIGKNYDIGPNLRVLEFKKWITLFTLTLEDLNGFDDYINNYKTAVSELRKYKSKAVEDNALLHALLLHSVEAEAFTNVKLQVNKDMGLKPDSIVNLLHNHHLAISTDKCFTGFQCGSKTGSNLKSCRGKSSLDVKKVKECPRFPNGLCDTIGDPMWQQLCQWKELFNRPN